MPALKMPIILAHKSLSSPERPNRTLTRRSLCTTSTSTTSSTKDTSDGALKTALLLGLGAGVCKDGGHSHQALKETEVSSVSQKRNLMSAGVGLEVHAVELTKRRDLSDIIVKVGGIDRQICNESGREEKMRKEGRCVLMDDLELRKRGHGTVIIYSINSS